MAENRTGTSAATRNTEYFAVVDKLYKPHDGEKVFDIYGQRILVKNPEALENFKDMAKFWHTFAEEIFFPILNILKKDLFASIISYQFKAIDLIHDIKNNILDKKSRRPANRNIDFSTMTFERVYEQVFGEDADDIFLSNFRVYEMEVKAFRDDIEHIKGSKNDFLEMLVYDFQKIVAVYTYCLKAFGYNIFSVGEIKNNSFDETLADLEYIYYEDANHSFLSEEKLKSVMVDIIAIDPYFLGGWAFHFTTSLYGDKDSEIPKALEIIEPGTTKEWNEFLFQMIDQDVKIPFSYDKEKLMADLISCEKSMEYDHTKYGLPENVVSPKLQEVRNKIDELIADKNHEAELKQFTEEARKTSKYGEKSRSTAMLLLIFGGLFGAHKFYEGKIGMGILYFFTAGLYFIGLIIDFIVLFEMPEKYIPGQKYHK